MIQSLLIAVNAVVPFLIYLGFGFFARSVGIVKEDFLNELNRVIFRLFFPFLTFFNIYDADIDAFPSTAMLIFTVAGILGLEAVLMLTVPRLVKENSRRGVIIQAIYRSNYILFAMPLALNIYGDSVGSVTALTVTIVVTIYNVTSVIILEYFNSAGKDAGSAGNKASMAKGIALNVVKNPLLQGAVVGLVFLFLGISLPSSVESAIETISDLASPLALFILGGTLSFGSMRRNLKYLVPALTAKLVVIPIIMVSIGYALGLRSAELFLVLAMYGTPIAVSSFPMAQNMGGDGELAGQFVVLSTVVSVVTLFLWIFALDYLGLLF